MNPGALYSRLFEHRSGRVIAICRLAMALIFYSALWLDPLQPVHQDRFGILMLGGYLVITVLLTALAWQSWWYDHLAAVPAFALDVAVFLAAVFYTESTSSDFVSPFLSFFAFLMLSANVRWGWRHTAWLAAAISLAFVVLGFRLHETGVVVDLLRFGRRIVYMLMMALVLVWFGSQKQATVPPRFNPSEDEPGNVLASALIYARQASGADSAAIAWIDEDEPRFTVLTSGAVGETRTAMAADAVDLRDADEAMLFDLGKRRELALLPPNLIEARKDREPSLLLSRLPFEEGISVPLFGSTGFGQLVLSRIRGMSADHTRLGKEIGREIALAIDRDQFAAVANDAKLMRLRSSIARDLHDSVSQSLAGASFRLAALRNVISGGGDPLDELDSIRSGLSGEQENVREIIRRLREAEIAPGDHSVSRELAKLAAQLAHHWNVVIQSRQVDPQITAGVPLIHEIHQLVREAVANAVRHGGADTIGIELVRRRQQLVLTVTDNGKGFASSAGDDAPRSLAERLAAMNGTLVISSRQGETRIVMTIPSRGSA